MLDRIDRHEGWSGQFRAPLASDIQLGWQYDSTTDEYKKQIEASNVNVLSPRWLFVGSTGLTTNNTDASLVSWAHAKGKKVWVLAGNHSDSKATHTMLSQADVRKKTVSQLVAAIKSSGADGLNIDFENVAAADRGDLTQFAMRAIRWAQGYSRYAVYRPVSRCGQRLDCSL